MKACQQTPGQSVYEHGFAVWRYLDDLAVDDGFDEEHFASMRLPDWYTNNKDFIRTNLYSNCTLIKYAVYHDCGKPYCLTIDDDGKRHFPNHAEVSKAKWLECHPDPRVLVGGPKLGEYVSTVLIGELIGLDMIFHTETWEQIHARNLPTKTICTLLCSALAELHANADMFGGIESTSFKIKWKRLNKLGNRAITFVLDEEANRTTR